MKVGTCAVVWIALAVLAAGVIMAGRATAQQAGDPRVRHRYMPPVTITQETTQWGQYHGQEIPEKVAGRSEFSFSTDGSQAERNWQALDGHTLNLTMWKVRRADGVIAFLNSTTKQIYAIRQGESGRGRQEEGSLGPLPETSCLANEFGNMSGGRLVGESKILGYRSLV